MKKSKRKENLRELGCVPFWFGLNFLVEDEAQNSYCWYKSLTQEVTNQTISYVWRKWSSPLCVQERKELDLLDHIVQAKVQNYSYS